MNRHPVTSSMTVQALAVVAAFGMTAGVLAGVDTVARQRTVSPYAQVVQLERVVVTGQRLSVVAAANARSTSQGQCEAAAQGAAGKTC